MPEEFQTAENSNNISQDASQVQSEQAENRSNDNDLEQKLNEIYADAIAEPEAEQPKDAKVSGQKQEHENESPDVSNDNLKAPHTWNKAEQEAWEQAPPKVREALLRRANQLEAYGQSLMEAKGFAKAMQPFGQMLMEMQPYFAMQKNVDGQPLLGNPQAMAADIKEMMQAKANIIQNPVQGFKDLVAWGRAQGLDMGQVLVEMVKDMQAWPDANTVRAQNEAERLRRELAFREQQQAAMQQQNQMQAAYVQLNKTIDDFVDQKLPDGGNAFPHLHGDHAEAIGTRIGAYIKANIEQYGSLTPKLFQDAYETAVWSIPQTKQIEQANLEQARVKQFQENSKRARAAAGFTPSANTSAKGGQTSLSDEDVMSAIWNKHQTGG